jgi:hypothetical protein
VGKTDLVVVAVQGAPGDKAITAWHPQVQGHVNYVQKSFKVFVEQRDGTKPDQGQETTGPNDGLARTNSTSHAFDDRVLLDFFFPFLSSRRQTKRNSDAINAKSNIGHLMSSSECWYLTLCRNAGTYGHRYGWRDSC